MTKYCAYHKRALSSVKFVVSNGCFSTYVFEGDYSSEIIIYFAPPSVDKVDLRS